MNVTADATRRHLIQGRQMTCPRCKVSRDILDFQRLEEIEEFEPDTTPIYKCPKPRGGCSWVFAPAEHTVLSAIHESATNGDGE